MPPEPTDDEFREHMKYMSAVDKDFLVNLMLARNKVDHATAVLDKSGTQCLIAETDLQAAKGNLKEMVKLKK